MDFLKKVSSNLPMGVAVGFGVIIANFVVDQVRKAL